ncbi:hypothetical protein [Bacillus pumilus]|uniref:Uncharacterized protein n=1 Tax=Bacillus pumilus TaxID=1408 RepID=A0AAD0HNP1_BACPU|nr:hypothetical protein [Bacillus pumilus]AVM24289.1 hypothetical protein C5695_10760 [Bacillus pumilus]TYS42798.1 hypothetical protein FZC68_10330 [Bacillus pumilus]
MSEKLTQLEKELWDVTVKKEMLETSIKKKKAEVERELIDKTSISIANRGNVDKSDVRVILDDLVVKIKSLHNVF